MDEFGKWLNRVEELLDILDSGLGMANAIGTPPASDDPHARAEILTSLWQRCQFRVGTDGDNAPWDAQVGAAAARLRDLPEQLMRKLFFAVEPALGEVLREVGHDPSRRLISTANLPVNFLEMAIAGPLRATWADVELAQLQPDHPIRSVVPIGAGYRVGAASQTREIAFLGIGQLKPTANGGKQWQPPAFTVLAEVQRWTVIARRQQDTEQAERERQERQRLEQAERERRAAIMPDQRIEALERKLAAQQTELDALRTQQQQKAS